MSERFRNAAVWYGLVCASLWGGVAFGEAAVPPCAAEIQRFCAHVETGAGKLHYCLKEHQAELSPSCADKLGKLEARRQAIRQLCAADAGKFCGHAMPGGGRVAGCLRQHRAELSPACAAKLAAPGG